MLRVQPVHETTGEKPDRRSTEPGDDPPRPLVRSLIDAVLRAEARSRQQQAEAGDRRGTPRTRTRPQRRTSDAEEHDAQVEHGSAHATDQPVSEEPQGLGCVRESHRGRSTEQLVPGMEFVVVRGHVMNMRRVHVSAAAARHDVCERPALGRVPRIELEVVDIPAHRGYIVILRLLDQVPDRPFGVMCHVRTMELAVDSQRLTRDQDFCPLAAGHRLEPGKLIRINGAVGSGINADQQHVFGLNGVIGPRLDRTGLAQPTRPSITFGIGSRGAGSAPEDAKQPVRKTAAGGRVYLRLGRVLPGEVIHEPAEPVVPVMVTRQPINGLSYGEVIFQTWCVDADADADSRKPIRAVDRSWIVVNVAGRVDHITGDQHEPRLGSG